MDLGILGVHGLVRLTQRYLHTYVAVGNKVITRVKIFC